MNPGRPSLNASTGVCEAWRFAYQTRCFTHAKKDGPTQGPLNIAGRCPLREVKRGPREEWPSAIIDGACNVPAGGGIEPESGTSFHPPKERMTGQGHARKPQRGRSP